MIAVPTFHLRPARKVALAALACAVVAMLAAAPGRAQSIIPTPGNSGDQLIFFYDARTNRVPFLAVSNFAEQAVVVETVFYGQNLNVITTEVATIPARGALPTIDPTDTARFPGVNGNAGLVVVTAVQSMGDTTPVVPPAPSDDTSAGPLFGGFTLANLGLNAGFGQNPFARIAVDQNGQRAAAGSVVDGVATRYQNIAPDVLTVPFYFNPQNLADPALDGNRIILGTFADTYNAGNFRIGAPAPAISFDYIMENSAGAVLVDTSNNVQVVDPISVAGVHFNDLQSLAGPLTLTGPGKVTFITTGAVPAGDNLFGLVSQAVGTFSVGQRMPGGFSMASMPSGVSGGTVPCNFGPVDVWAFTVASGENITVLADTVDAATAGDLQLLSLHCEASGGAQFRNVSIDDTVACTFPPPGFQCPMDSFMAGQSGVCVATVQARSTCTDPSIVHYSLTVTPARAVTLVGNDVTP
jgi:hypothetical protein